MVIVSTIALAQAPENVAAGAIILRGRYDVRGWFLAVSMALRLDRARDRMPARRRRARRSGWSWPRCSRRSRSASPASRRSGVSRRRRPSRSPTMSAPSAASSSPRRSPRRSTPPAGRSARRSLPAVAPIVQAGYFRNAQAPGNRLRSALGPGAARDAHRADARLRGRPATRRVFGMLQPLHRHDGLLDARRRPGPLDR